MANYFSGLELDTDIDEDMLDAEGEEILADQGPLSLFLLAF